MVYLSSRQDILPLLNNDLTLSQKLVHGWAQFGRGHVQLHTQELVVVFQDIDGLLPAF